MKKSMLQRVPATSQNKSLLQIDAAVEEWQSAEARKSFWFYRQLMNPRLLLTGYWFPRRISTPGPDDGEIAASVASALDDLGLKSFLAEKDSLGDRSS
jgi:hypothetical protein